MTSRRTIERRLERVRDFDAPDVALEQYRTPPALAAHLCHLAALQGDLAERPVVDLGTGTGMLAIGCALAGGTRIVGLERDPSALARARDNEVRILGTDPIEWVVGDGRRHPLALSDATVVSNPPFGAQRGNRHADRAFLESARDLGAVSYTIHNAGSQSFVEAFAADGGGVVTHAFAAAFPVDRRFEFHTDERRELEVEVFRIEWPGR
ncbi:METTL5 family protein [Natronobiforma cellulositropha]|uniref:METTL5 family protein n=1 Tax=Natronobiforma cellulositropha TaxID=1679076 RepID=UPI0021D59B4F|nr:METTL5 family protein [Natronobiforma cellulositropha]